VNDRQQHVGGGGLTGATGELTPDDSDRAFDPGERREVEDPAHHADVTQAQGGRAPAQRGETGEFGEMPEGDPTNMATRDDGYGSHHGLSPDDPAYRMESHPSPTPEAHEGSRTDEIQRETHIGGDEVSEGEEHF
jgi:hypothetical protein